MYMYFIGSSQLCAQHGCLLFSDIPTADQGQTQWKHHDY